MDSLYIVYAVIRCHYLHLYYTLLKYIPAKPFVFRVHVFNPVVTNIHDR